MDALYNACAERFSEADMKLLERAMEIAGRAHEKQKRESGEAYITHPQAVALMLLEMGMDANTVIAGLLHDVVEDGDNITVDMLRQIFGADIAEMVDGATKLTKTGKSDLLSKEEAQAENLRKMFLAIAKDVRVVIIKLADRLHNMRTLEYCTPEKQMRKARETLDVYAPLADRFGMGAIKCELEDLCFHYLWPEEAAQLKRQIEPQQRERMQTLESAINTIKAQLEEAGIEAQINGRPKHLYSIYKKVQKQSRALSEIYDLIAVRVIVNTINDCYAALGVIHAIWRPVPGRFKDYIAMPKTNMYRSLHTTLFSETGMPFEVQIRTLEMHRTSEYGIAAHWMYKEGRAEQDELDSKLAWLREALELENYADTTSEFVENIRKDFFSDYVYVLTPRGQIIDLVAGSTPLDFAYRIHSNVGNHAQHAKVNGAIVRLDYKLKNNDVVEIVTAPNATPSRDWLKLVKTQQAKAKIRQWFKKANREENVARGREMLSEAAKRQGRQLSELTKKEYCEDLLRRFNMNDLDDVYAAIGYGGISTGQVLHKLMEQLRKEERAAQFAAKLEQKEEQRTAQAVRNHGIIVRGEPNMSVRFAHCCSPLPGDAIIGYITRGRGVSVHRKDCPNVADLMLSSERMIDVEWASTEKAAYPVNIQVTSDERAGLLMDISQLLMNLNISILSMNARTSEDTVSVQMGFNVTSADQLNSIMKGMRKVRGVREAYRLNV